MYQDCIGSAGRASGSERDVSTSRASKRVGPSKLDPSLSSSEQERRYRVAPADKVGAQTKAQREAFWVFRDLVTAATDAGVSRRAIAQELGIDESYLNGLCSPGDSRMPSAAHLLGVMLSPRVPDGAKRVVHGVIGELAGICSHVKAGGLVRGVRVGGAQVGAETAMDVAKESGELVKAIADAVDVQGEGGAAITEREARSIRREAGDAAESCVAAGVTLGGGQIGMVLDVTG